MTLLWFLAVYKVFLLESGPIIHSSALAFSVISSSHLNLGKPIPGTYIKSSNSLIRKKNGAIASNINAPLASDWLGIRSNPNNYKPEGDKGKLPIAANLDSPVVPVIDSAPHFAASITLKEPWKLTWPAVSIIDGSVPVDEGTDVMPLTGALVPRFWAPKPTEDLNKIGSFINDKETIFLMIASYRDFQCRETIASAFAKSDHPERLFVGAVDQVVDGDIGCLDVAIPCLENPDQPLCKYSNQIAVYKMNAEIATGPVTARHIGDRMYRGEYFVMQMDAHCLFIKHWDTLIIDQWKSTKNEMAVLSSYLTDLQGSIDGQGNSLRTTRPIMCNSDYEGLMPARYLRHGSQPEEESSIRDMPQLEPFWAAGFSFSRGHFKVRVPYDGYQPMVFQGEEIAIGIRGFTHGYDFYAPKTSVVFHEYAEKSDRRKKIHMFWEHSEAHKGEGQKSLKRSMSVVRMSLDIPDDQYDHSDISKYGLGTVRDVELYYKLFLINRVDRKATQLCPFVRPGYMHRDFQKFLRSDGLGIDYTHLESYDTRAKLTAIGGGKGIF